MQKSIYFHPPTAHTKSTKTHTPCNKNRESSANIMENLKFILQHKNIMLGLHLNMNQGT